MNLIERVRSINPQVNLIWRFFSDSAHHWKWQRLAFDGTVIEHSSSAYSQYEDCLANASDHGYVSCPALSTKANSASSQAKRSYTPIATGHQKIVPAIARKALEHGGDLPVDDALDGD